MGKEQPTEYYDSIYKTSKEYNQHYTKSRYYNLWKRVIKNLDQNKTVFEFGCGTGQLAEMLHDNKFVSYFGIDFSEEAIRIAKLINANNFTFVVGDILNMCLPKDVDDEGEKTPQIICCETLEHIEKDKEFINRLREVYPGSRIVFTVPTFNDAAHVRYFKDLFGGYFYYKPLFSKVITYEKFGGWLLFECEL